MCYVFGGGSLLQCVTWPQDVTYSDIISKYVSYIKRRYCNATIVFDGYDSGPSAKDVTNNRRSGRVAQDIDFSGNMRVCVNVEPFLNNEANKQRLIIMLICTLHGAGYGAIQAFYVDCPHNLSDRRDICHSSHRSVVSAHSHKLSRCVFRTWTKQRQH